MITENDEEDFVRFAHNIGYDIGENMRQNIELLYQKTFIFLPELAVFIASYVVKKTFTRPTTPPKYIKNSIRFFFHNIFDYDERGNGSRSHKISEKPPYVRIFPSSLSHTSRFKKNARVKVVSVFISADYLKGFLKDDAVKFPFLFGNDNNFLIEEMMTDDLLRTVNDIVGIEEPGTLKSYHYKLKTMELLFYLFQALSKRENAVHQKLSQSDIKSIYKVRDKLAATLHQPIRIAELKRAAGMNELKLRRLFTQVFGRGIYDYYQHLRMKEAARLLREEKRSVSEVGYQMGFENLSHFSRVFEKHIGKKPKKYSTAFT